MATSPHIDSKRTDRSLQDRLAENAQQSRRDFSTPRFGASDYRQLLDTAARARKALETAGVSADGLEGIDRHVRVLERVLALKENPDAEVQAPTQVEVYRTCVETSRLETIASVLAKAPVWIPRLEDMLRARATEQPPAQTPSDDIAFELLFASLCRRAGYKLEPVSERLSQTAIDGWNVAFCTQRVGSVETLPDDVAAASERLRDAHKPGLLVLDLSSVAWPQRKVLKVDSDATAVAEIHRLVDECLIEHYETIVRSALPDFAVGAIGCVTLGTLNASNDTLAFASNFRVAALVDEDDPRRVKLTRFTQRFSESGSAGRSRNH